MRSTSTYCSIVDRFSLFLNTPSLKSSHSISRVSTSRNRVGWNIQVTTNQRQNATHLRTRERTIWVIFSAQACPPSIGRYPPSARTSASFVSGRRISRLRSLRLFAMHSSFRYNISTSDYDGWNTDAKSNRGNLYIMNGYDPSFVVRIVDRCYL